MRPAIGVRVKLASRGAGRWRSSAGYRSKFGLTLTEVLEALRVPQSTRHGRLPAAGALPPRQPDHQHPQGQGRAHRSRPRLRRTAPPRRGLKYHRRRRRPGHRLRRLADRLRIEHQLHAAGIRQRRGLPHQERLRRGRRAAPDDHQRIAAGRWSRITRVLVFDVLGTIELRPLRPPPDELPDDAPQPIRDLFDIYRDLNKKNFLESYHDAVQADGRDAQSLQPRLSARSNCGPWPSGCSGRSCRKLAADRPRTRLRARRVATASTPCSRTPTSATSRSSSRCPTRGRSSSSSRSCRSTG